MKIIYFLSIIGAFCFGQQIYGQCVTDTNNIYSFDYGSKHYEIVKENLNWENAAACAVEKGGILCEIGSQGEQDAVFAEFANASINAANTRAPDGFASYLWLGGNDIQGEEGWVWDGDNMGSSVQFWAGGVNGTPIAGRYNNWGNEPDNFQDQDGLGIALGNWPRGKAGEWNDIKVSNELYFIVETIPKPTSIDKVYPRVKLNLFPNPSSGTFTVTIPPELMQQKNPVIQLYNIQGQIVKEIKVKSHQMTIDLLNFENGMYFVKYKDIPIATKIIIQH